MDQIHFCIENLRSFKDQQDIQFSARSLIVTGKNNSGKLNVLRAFAHIYNKYENNRYIHPMYDFHSQAPSAFRFSLFCPTDAALFSSAINKSHNFGRLLARLSEIEIPYFANQTKTELDKKKFTRLLDDVIPAGVDAGISKELAGSWGDRAHNLANIFGHLARIMRDGEELGDDCGKKRAIHVANRCSIELQCASALRHSRHERRYAASV